MATAEQVALVANISTIVGLMIVLASVAPKVFRFLRRLRITLEPDDQTK
jgi:hypothetical protein